MVFIFETNFEFSAARTSTYGPLWSAGALIVAVVSLAIGDTSGFSTALAGLNLLIVPGVTGGAVRS
jgi:hypothetical protein